MGNSEDWKPCKIEKPAEDQNPADAYPDWPMMQAYYGLHFTVPLYVNSAVALPPPPPPYMLVVPPQPQYTLLPYPVYYAHEGGVYAHPGLGLSTGFSMAESTGNTEGNENAESGEHGRLSESELTEDSRDGIDGVTAEEVGTGELATQVETLVSENMLLKSEIDKFTDISKKLELENAILMETIKEARLGEINSHEIDGVNLLARVDSNGSTERRDEDGDESYEQTKASSAAQSDEQMW